MKVERYFQRTADAFHSLYDENRKFSFFLNQYLRRAMHDRVMFTVDELKKVPGCSVLDVGCGSGRNSILFIEAGASRVVGIDFSERMIELADECSTQKGVRSRCEFIKGDFLSYPFAQKCDFVVALGVFDYVSDSVTFLSRMRQFANRAVIASFPGTSLVRAPLRKVRYGLRGCPVYFYTHRQLSEMCTKAGFTDYSITRISSSGYMVMGKVDGAV